MGFGKDAYRDECEKKVVMPEILRGGLETNSEIVADDWIEKTGKDRKKYSQTAIEDYGQLVIRDYVLFQATPKEYCNTVSHKWDGQTLERLVARVYSDRNGIIPVFGSSEKDRSEHDWYGKDLPLVGFAENFRCREKLPSSAWITREVRNVVTCDIVLFKSIDTPFFNSAVLGSRGCNSYVDGDDCKFEFIATSNDIGTPCYVSASMSNLQNKVKEQAQKIEELEKKSCKSNRQKRGCCHDDCDPTGCALEEKGCDKEDYYKDEICEDKEGIKIKS